MKHVIYVLLFAVLYVNAQVSNTGDTSNYYQYIDAYSKAHGDSIPEKRIQRQIYRWLPRLSPDGDTKRAAQAWQDYAQNYSTYATNSYNPNWTNIGPIGTTETTRCQNGRIHNIVFDPKYSSNQTIYACTSYGGLWRSDDDGNTWSNVNTDIGIPAAKVADVAIDPNDSDYLYIATGEADEGVVTRIASGIGYNSPYFSIGVYRSPDRGVTWQPINNGLQNTLIDRNNIREIEINPLNRNQIFILTERGIYRTNNARDPTPVWTQVFTGLNGEEDNQLKGLEFKPDDVNTVYASGLDIYRSTDGGDTWQSMTGLTTGLDLDNMPLLDNTSTFELNRINIAVNPSQINKIYAYIVGKKITNNYIYGHKYIYVFENGTWSKKLSQYNADLTRTPITVTSIGDNVDLVVFGDTNVRTLKIDYQNNTQQVTDISYYAFGNTYGTHADVHALAFPPNDNSRVFCGSDGGISMYPSPATPSTINNWQAKNNGLSVSLIWSFDDSETDNDYLLAGFQDNSVMFSNRNNNTFNWTYIFGCDGYGAQVNDTDDGNAFFITCGRLYRFNHNISYPNLNTSSSAIPKETSGRAVSNPNRMYIDYRPLNPLYPNDNSKRLLLPKDFEIKTEPKSGDQYWSYTEIQKRLKKIPDVSEQDYPNIDNLWQRDSNIYTFQTNQIRRQLTRFEISEANPNYRYTTNIGVVNIPNPIESTLYKATDGSTNYTIVQQPTPLVHSSPLITDIVLDPLNPQHLWITYTGFINNFKVFESNDAGNSWTNADPNNSLPNLPVNAITYQKGSNDILYIATDAGVYVKNGPTANWEKYGASPNVSVQDIKINYCSNKLRISTYGRGIWEADIIEIDAPLNEIVFKAGENVTWGDAVKRGLRNSIRIQSGATLTIKSELSMPEKAKITIEPGGKLILDGCKLTQKCDKIWQGIQVQGNASFTCNRSQPRYANY